MSGRALSWAFAQQIEPHLRFTLVAIADAHNHRTGQCNPGLSVLHGKTGKSLRTLREDIAWLESHGYLRRDFRHRANGSQTTSFYVLPLGGPAVYRRGALRQTAALEPELEPEEEPQHAALAGSEEQEQESMDAYEDIWGSSAERDAQERAREQREAKERAARARHQALAALPRSQWRPGHLETFFRAKVLELSLPRQPQMDRRALRGSFNMLLANGHKPEELATAIEEFCADRSLWSDLVERQGAPIWKVFVKLAPTMTTRAGAPISPVASAPVRDRVSQNRLPGRDW